MLPEQGTRLLRAVLVNKETEQRFIIHDRERSVANLGSSIEHFSLTIPNEQAPRRPLTNCAPESVRSRCTEEVTQHNLYTTLRKNGNQYGPVFQRLERLWRQNGEALGLLAAPPSTLEMGDYRACALLLDAAVQTLATANDDNGRAYVLASVDEMRIHVHADTGRWTYATIIADAKENQSSITGNVCVLDNSGHTIVDFFGVRLKYWQPRQPIGKPQVPTIAISATFTAQPIENCIAFWMQQFNTPCKIAFAPYNQVFQQLLEPSSLFCTNYGGLNVIMLRLQDWLPSRNDSVGAPGSTLEFIWDHSRCRLPNHQEIVHIHSYETETLYREIFSERSYLKEGITLHEGDCVIDVGANIGLFSLFVQQQIKDATIYAFEPCPSVFSVLQANLRSYCPTAKAFCCALSDRLATAPFTFYRNSTVFSSRYADPVQDKATLKAIVRNILESTNLAAGTALEPLSDELICERLDGETLMCEFQTLSSVIRNEGIDRIDLLKIDAEKSELDILRGIEDEHWDLIAQIVVEVHDSRGVLVEEIMSLLRAHNFDVVQRQEKGLEHAGLYKVFAVRGKHNRTGRSSELTDIPQETQRTLQEFVSALCTAQARSETPILIFLGPPSAVVRRDFVTATLLDRMEKQLVSQLRSRQSISVITFSDVLSTYPISEWDDPYANELGSIPYTAEFYTAIGTLVARRYLAGHRRSYKCIVLDCDQVLWDGVCAEDGPDGVSLSPERRELQEFMVRQHDEGKLLAICSKNNEEDLFTVFERHPEMPLRPSHVSAWRVNWGPKSENIRSIGRELQLGLETFIFLDDDPSECAEVQARCPEVLTLQLPQNVAGIRHYLNHVWAFDQAATTREDKSRVASYKDNRKREQLRKNSPNLASFLAGLNLKVGFSPATPEHISRIAQMFQRTNQFHMTGRRRSRGDVETILRTASPEGLVVSVDDRFGEYGIVGLLLFREFDDALKVDDFLLSCRALGKSVEHRMLARIGEIAMERRLQWVDVTYTATSRNQQALQFVDCLRSRCILDCQEQTLPLESGPGDFGTGVLRLSAEHASRTTAEAVAGETPRVGDVEPLICPAEPYPESSLLVHTATAWNDVERIVKAIEAYRMRSRPNASRTFAPPATALEMTIADIWQKVLGIDVVGIHDNFFEIGGNSLRAVEVLSLLRRVLSVDFPFVSIFQHPTINSMVQALASSDKSGGISPVRGRGEDWRLKKIAKRRSTNLTTSSEL
jgi:FkbH-like protein/FkbM family methyltransferase